MKLFLSFLLAILFFNVTVANPIMASVVFENLTGKTSISGVFIITETNQKILINSLDNFSIELPKSGKYHFRFHSDEVNAYTYYPERITARKNTVTIRIENKEEIHLTDNFPTKDLTDFSIDQIEEQINTGAANFIVHGLVALLPETVQAFKNDYGVGFISKNCVVDPVSFKTAVTNNRKVAAYLSSRFGNDWKNRLPGHPFGLQF